MSFIRYCPKCQKELKYKSRSSFWLANKNNSKCKSCALTGVNNPMFGKPSSFLGHHHTEANKELFRKNATGKILSPEAKAIAIKNGIGKLVHGDIFKYWLDRYGKDEADKRMAICKAKHSKNNSGSGNPMFGKPSPQGSGNGWSGWYKGWYFRSLRELKYVLELDKLGIQWSTGERQKLKVPYIDPLGHQRTYFPDFIIGNKIVEIKPERLWSTPLITAKSTAARAFFAERGMVYEIIDPGKFEDDSFDKLIKDGTVRLTKRYEIKYRERKI